MSRRDEQIKIKMKKSAAFINEADKLLENKFYNTLISRLYYSCFHATKALLLTKDLVSKTHSGTVTLLNQNFVKEKTFDSAQAAFFQSLMNERVESDYDDFIIFDEERVVKLIEPSRQYVKYVFKLIEKYFDENPNNIDKPNLFP